MGDGVRSVLEHRYLKSVERAHGLPRGKRQQAWVLGGRRAYPDVEYEEAKVLVHLDGRIGHIDSLDRWADFERDLDGMGESIVSARVGWRQVLDPCRLAVAISKILHVQGVDGSDASLRTELHRISDPWRGFCGANQ